MSPRIFGVVLAAGFGARMGAPKIFLHLTGDPVPLVVRHVDRLFEAGCERVLVVARPEHRAFVGRAETIEATTCSQGCSLSVASRALPTPAGEDDRVLVTPVDVMPASLSTLGRALGLLEGQLAVTPSYAGHSGHPALLMRVVLDGHFDRSECIDGHRPAPALRDVLRALGSRRRHLEVNEPSVTIDFDVPADLVGT